jgi:hypothetical protein
MITQSRKFKPVKCWGCGQGHNLRERPTTSEEEKQRIYQQRREQRPTSKPHQSNQANTSTVTQSRPILSNITTPSTDKCAAVARKPITPATATPITPSTTTMSRRSELTFAAAAKHRAKMDNDTHHPHLEEQLYGP